MIHIATCPPLGSYGAKPDRSRPRSSYDHLSTASGVIAEEEHFVTFDHLAKLGWLCLPIIL